MTNKTVIKWSIAIVAFYFGMHFMSVALTGKWDYDPHLGWLTGALAFFALSSTAMDWDSK